MKILKEDFVPFQTSFSIYLWKNPLSSTGMWKASYAWFRSQNVSV